MKPSTEGGSDSEGAPGGQNRALPKAEGVTGKGS